MTEKSEEEIHAEVLTVYRNLGVTLNRDVSDLSASTKLETGLKLTQEQRRIAASPLSDITYPLCGKKVTRAEAANFKKVSDAQKLCWKRINA